MSNTTQRQPPAIDIIESEELLQYIDPALLKLDYDDISIRTALIASSFIFFAVIFTSIILLCSLVTSFKTLDLKFRVFLSLSISRGIYGIFATVLGSYAIFQTTNLDRDVVFGTNATTFLAMLLSVGFFIFELFAVLMSDIVFKSFSKMLITHHGLALVGYAICVSNNANFCFACKALILEMSTPFSCLCYVLLKAGKEHSMFWKINQMILIHTFHLRSVVECHLWYITYRNWKYIYNFMPPVPFILLALNLVLVTFVMTPYWGYKKTQQLFNPVDWNFQESRNTDNLANGNAKIINQNAKKVD